MKKLLTILVLGFLLSCNNSAVVTPASDADRTKNNDTAPLPDTAGLHTQDSSAVGH